MKAHTDNAQSNQLAGFSIPTNLAEFPLTPRSGLRLSLEQEQAFGFSVLEITLHQIQAIACDTEVVAGLLSDMEAGFTKNNKAEKAVSLVKVDGLWFRQGSINDKDFSAYARARLGNVRASLAAMASLDGKDRDLFYMQALDGLRSALSELVPYDMLLTKAFNAFKERCMDLNAACRDLVKYVASEIHLSRPTVQDVCRQFWLSNKLPAICFGANRYIQSIMPAKAKREFRFGVLERQQRIANVALASGVPVIELLGSWSNFTTHHQRSDRLVGSFAMVNAGLAEKVSRDYNFASDYDQVRSAAYQGLTRAISLYAPEKGMKFSTYAVTWIKQTIIRDLIQQELVRLPEGSHKTLGRVRAVYADLPHASDEYVCKAANITAFELEGLRPFLQGNGAMSMDTLPNSDGEDSGLHSLLADENNDFVSQLEEESDLDYIVGLVREALTEREFIVLSHRSGLGGVKVIPVAELALLIDTSPQNISRMERKAQEKLADVAGLKNVWDMMV